MTNMANVHTLAIGRVDLLTAVILLLHGELVELTGDVVSGTGVITPVCVHSIGRHRVGAFFLLLFFFFFFFFFVVVVVGEAMPAPPCGMTLLVVDLVVDVALFAAATSPATGATAIVASSAT